MSLISSIAKSFNFKIPDSLSKITGSSIVDTVKNLAKVAGDTFLKPSTDGKGIFQSEVSLFGMRLPNPVNVLAEKLLGKAGEKIKELGFSPEAIANLFTGGRNVTDVGETTLPTLNDRVKELTTGAKTQSGGGTTKTTSTQKGGSVQTTSSTGIDVADKAIARMGGTLDSLEGQIDALIAKGDKMTMSEQLQAQKLAQKRSELYQLLSQLLSMEHQTKSSIIQNTRA